MKNSKLFVVDKKISKEQIERIANYIESVFAYPYLKSGVRPRLLVPYNPIEEKQPEDKEENIIKEIQIFMFTIEFINDAIGRMLKFIYEKIENNFGDKFLDSELLDLLSEYKEMIEYKPIDIPEDLRIAVENVLNMELCSEGLKPMDFSECGDCSKEDILNSIIKHDVSRLLFLDKWKEELIVALKEIRVLIEVI